MGSEPLILLDTHALVWLTEGDDRLGKKARKKLDEALINDSLAVSAISFWEIAMLSRKGRIDLHRPLDVWREALLESGLVEIPLSGEIGIVAASLDEFHGDPADRMIVATAMIDGATLVTADARILGWKGKLRTRDARV